MNSDSRCSTAFIVQEWDFKRILRKLHPLPFDVSQLKHQSVPFEGCKNTSGEVRESKHKGGHEIMCFKERIMEKERNREMGV